MESTPWRGDIMANSLPSPALSSGPPPVLGPTSALGTPPASGSMASLPTSTGPTPSSSAPWGSHTVRAGSVRGANRKADILATKGPQHQALPGTQRPRSSAKDQIPSSAEESEGTCDPEDEPEDSWQRMRKLAAEEGDWELVAKIQEAPVWYQRRANPRWESITHGEMKDLCKAAKDHGRGSP